MGEAAAKALHQTTGFEGVVSKSELSLATTWLNSRLLALMPPFFDHQKSPVLNQAGLLRQVEVELENLLVAYIPQH
jgi:hypothetical protein